MAEDLGVESGRAHVLMTLAELELARSNHQAAARWANAALEQAQRMGEATNVGEAHVWLARIAAARGEAAKADGEFAVAFEKFESADAAEWLARSHCMYAEILEARGELATANRHLRSAIAALGMPSPVVPRLQVAIA
jgi:hypothetical protein